MRKMKESGIEWIGKIPSNWKVRKFKTLAKLCNGKEILSDGGDIPVYGSGGIFKWTSTYLHKGESLLMGRKGTIDNPMLVNGEFWTVDTMFYTSKFFDTIGKFLFYSCKGIINYDYYKSGSVLPSMTQTEVNNILLPIPPLSEQQAIADYLDCKCGQVDALVKNVREQIEQLKAYKQSLISEVVTKGLNPNAPMKDSGVEWIGEIPEAWEVKRIKDLFVLRNERNDEADLAKVNLISLYTDLGVVQHSDIIETTGNRAVTADGYKLVYPNDIVVNIILCWMGAIGMSKYEGVTSPAYDIYRPLEGTLSHYYHYLFRTPKFNGECYRYGRGIMMMRWRTYSSEFRSISIPVPPLFEQQAIAEYLGTKCGQIDRLIALKEAKIAQLEAYKKSLIYEVVTGKRVTNDEL